MFTSPQGQLLFLYDLDLLIKNKAKKNKAKKKIAPDIRSVFSHRGVPPLLTLPSLLCSTFSFLSLPAPLAPLRSTPVLCARFTHARSLSTLWTTSDLSYPLVLFSPLLKYNSIYLLVLIGFIIWLHRTLVLCNRQWAHWFL